MRQASRDGARRRDADGAHRTDLRALDILLAESDPITAGELSTALGISPAATTTVLDRLQRAGLADRLPDPVNRRRVLVRVTGVARDAEDRIYEPVHNAGAKALGKYSLEQLALIVDFLNTARQVQETAATRIATRP